MNDIDWSVYYTEPGVMTDPGAHTDLLKGLPGDIPSLCKVVQGVLLHMHWAKRYGQELTEERKAEANIRRASDRLADIRAKDPRPVIEARPPELKQVGTCRDYTVMLVALLKHLGIPARARCGFGAYFTPGKYEDHWVGEYWDEDARRWVLVDAQLDDLQRAALGIDFDPCDVPRDRFLIAGRAWQMARNGQADPNNFGIFDMWGL
ncbi:MAG: transglutaminase domain-containing protein, partial [Anaerolineae bacterium]|nr:transglutaminase domain-containing protein [Anaerolineae bacterium]